MKSKNWFKLLAIACLQFLLFKTYAQNWVNVGAPGFSQGLASYTSLSFDSSGTLYTAYKDFGAAGKVSVNKFDQPSWTPVGSVGFSDGAADYIKLACSGTTPYVVYQDFANGYKASVKKYNGISWVNVGLPGFSAGAVDYTAITFGGTTPYVAFADYNNSRKVSVMKFDGTNWLNVGMAGFSAGEADYVSIAVNGTTPYVAFKDQDNGGKATVMQFDGSNWVTLGSGGFSADAADYTSIALKGNLPFVVYKDYGNSDKATVMSYDGTMWNSVGTPAISAGSVSNTTISFYGNKPYIAYTDGSVGNKASVLKYDGVKWLVVGSLGFSGGVTGYTNIAMSGNGSPYVIFKDGSNGGKSTVMMFDCAPSYSIENTKVCAPDLPYTWNGMSISNPGTYKDTLINALGCDSIATLNFTVKYPTTSTQTITRCTSYNWNGTNYTVAGTYTYNTVNAAGCDSTATLNLILDNSGTLTQNVTTCGSYVWNGKTYTKSGVYKYVSTTAGCTLTATLNLTIPVVSATFSVVEPTCYNKATGTITVTATSGVAPILYKNGVNGVYQTSGVFTNIRANNYRIYMQDANGCSGYTALITVGQPSQIIATPVSTNVTCYNTATGTITVNTTGGTPPYMYKNGATGTYQSSNVFTGLRANSYRIYVQDANGCIGYTPLVAIGEATPITATFTQINETCINANNGSITVTASQGTPPYQYKNGVPGIYQSSNVFSPLRPNNYRIYIQDAHGCLGFTSLVTITAGTQTCTSLSKNSNENNSVNGTSLKVSLRPNPSGSRFTLSTETKVNQLVHVKIFDADGKNIYETKGQPGQAFTFGNDFAQGVYMIEVRQGDEVKTVKAIKTN